MEPERQFPLFRQEADQIRKLTMEFSRLKNNLLIKNKFTKKLPRLTTAWVNQKISRI